MGPAPASLPAGDVRWIEPGVATPLRPGDPMGGPVVSDTW